MKNRELNKCQDDYCINFLIFCLKSPIPGSVLRQLMSNSFRPGESNNSRFSQISGNAIAVSSTRLKNRKGLALHGTHGHCTFTTEGKIKMIQLMRKSTEKSNLYSVASVSLWLQCERRKTTLSLFVFYGEEKKPKV